MIRGWDRALPLQCGHKYLPCQYSTESYEGLAFVTFHQKILTALQFLLFLLEWLGVSCQRLVFLQGKTPA